MCETERGKGSSGFRETFLSHAFKTRLLSTSPEGRHTFLTSSSSSSDLVGFMPVSLLERGAHVTAPLCRHSFVRRTDLDLKLHFMVRKTQEALKGSHHCTLTRHLGDTWLEWSVCPPPTPSSRLPVSPPQPQGSNRVARGPYIQSLLWYIHHLHRVGGRRGS